MRILITTPELNKPGGVPSYLVTLTKYLSVHVDFFIIGSRSSRESVPKILIRLIKDICNFCRKLRTGGYDAVHLNPSLRWKAVIRDGLFLYLAKRNNTNVLIFFHGWDKDFEGRLTGLRLKIFKSVYFMADAIIILSKEFSERLRFWGYTGPIHLETSIVDDDVIEDLRLVESPRCESTIINLLFLARIEKAKGIYETIETYRLLNMKYSTLMLTIVGDGTELNELKEYVRYNKIGGIDFTGYTLGENKSNAFRNASIYLLPTYGEGMPNSVLEAMAFGLPVVTRSVGGLTDFFNNGKMGFMTESKDPAVLAGLIMKLIDNPKLRNQIGKYNQEYAMDHFLASKVAKRIEKIYQDMIDKTMASSPKLTHWQHSRIDVQSAQIPTIPKPSLVQSIIDKKKDRQTRQGPVEKKNPII